MKPTFGAVYEDEMRMRVGKRGVQGVGERKVDSTPSFILAFISSSSPSLLLLLFAVVFVGLVFRVSFLLFNFRLKSKHRTKSRENIEKKRNQNRVANVYNYLSLMALCVVYSSVCVWRFMWGT